MKKILFLLLLIPGLMFATPQAESEGITLAVEMDWKISNEGQAYGWKEGDETWYADHVIKEFTEATGISVEIVEVKTDDNTTKKLDAMIAAGMAPNVYADYGGRAGMYAGPQMALPLNKYISGEVIDRYFPSYIEMFTKGGNLYALPLTSWATMGTINLDLLKLIGMESIVDDGLTFDEVYQAGKKLRDLGDYYATYLFANQSGGDYWIYTYWLGGFGARIYNQDGTIALNSPEGRAAITEMKRWYDEGLINKGAPGEGPGEYLGAFGGGNVLTANGGIGPVRSVANSGSFNAALIGTPRAPGVEFAPVATGPDIVLAFNTGTDADKRASARLVEWIAGERYQAARPGRFPSMFGVAEGVEDDPLWRQNVDYMEEHGVFYHGIGSKRYQEIRALWFPMIQAILTGELTVEEGLARFEKEGNAIIAR